MRPDTTADTMELTNFHLGRKQKMALRERARAKGTNVAEEIRSAVDAHLSGVAMNAPGPSRPIGLPRSIRCPCAAVH